MGKKFLARLLLIKTLNVLAVIIPALFPFYLAVNAGPISSNDYWGIIEKVFTVNGLSHNLRDWLISQNGHIVFIPRIIYAANIFLTNGSNIGLTLTTWVIALLQTLLLISLIPSDIQNQYIKIGMIFCISAFSFTPVDDAWVMGYSGVHWLGANLLAIASITCLVHYFHSNQLWKLIISLILAGAAIFTYGTSFSLWLSLGIGTLLFVRKLKIGLLFSGLTIFIGYRYLSIYGYQSSTPVAVLFNKITVLIHYTAVYLGAIFSKNEVLAGGLGGVALLIAMILVGTSIIRKPDNFRMEVFSWLLIISYAAGNAFITALNRSHLGINQAMMSRYASLPALAWVSIFVIIVSYSNRKHSVRNYVFSITGILILLMYSVGIAQAKQLLHRPVLQSVTMISVKLGIPDEFSFPFSITTAPAQFLNLIPALKKYNHIPFDSSNGNHCGNYGDTIPNELIIPVSSDNQNGHFDFIDVYTQNGARAVGWTKYHPHKIKCIVLLGNYNTIRGWAVAGFYYPGTESSFPNENIGWVGYVKPTSADEELAAYVLLWDTPYWLSLKNTHSLESPGPIDRTIYTYFLNP